MTSPMERTLHPPTVERAEQEQEEGTVPAVEVEALRHRFVALADNKSGTLWRKGPLSLEQSKRYPKQYKLQLIIENNDNNIIFLLLF